MRTIWLLPVLAACTPPLEAGFDADVDQAGACGDLLVFAVNDDDTTMISLRATDPYGDLGQDDQRTVSLALGSTASLTVSLGTNVSDLTCDGVTEAGGPDIQIEYVATEGTAELVATSTGGDVTLDLQVTGAKLREASVGYYKVEIADWSLSGVPLGSSPSPSGGTDTDAE